MEQLELPEPAQDNTLECLDVGRKDNSSSRVSESRVPLQCASVRWHLEVPCRPWFSLMERQSTRTIYDTPLPTVRVPNDRLV